MNKITILLLFILLFILNILTYKQIFNLNEDGITVINNILDKNDLNIINNLISNNKIKDVKKYIIENKNIYNKIIKLIGNYYLFHDYIFYIKKSKIHTCHRDYNGTLFNKDAKHPSYTILFYLNDMNSGLDIISGSHKSLLNNAINFYDITQGVKVKIADAIIFNSNLIHSGAFNKKDDNPRIQMKISHKDDIHLFDFYQKYNKILDKDNKTYKIFQKIQKSLSCQLPIISDVASYDAKKNVINKSFGKSWIEKFVSQILYSDNKFYDLKEAFQINI